MDKIKILSISAIIIIAVALSGCSRDKNNESPQPRSGEKQTETNVTEKTGGEVVSVENLVLIEKDKFNPQMLTVKKGTTVTWTNKDEAQHWIITDPHPTHNNLPDLDSKKGLLQNESYQYTFNQKGEFYYHDEINTIVTGKIIVE